MKKVKKSFVGSDPPTIPSNIHCFSIILENMLCGKMLGLTCP